jgi:hypothetical protein
MSKHYKFIKGHPLAGSEGRIRRSRLVLFNKLNGIAGKCNWCNEELTWKTLCADHLDSNIENDTADNLVGSCRGCNANRDDGTGKGRRKLRSCKKCLRLFLPMKTRAIYCSCKCANIDRPKRESKASHGTRTKYNYGCRCVECKKAQAKAYKEWYRKHYK